MLGFEEKDSLIVDGYADMLINDYKKVYGSRRAML